MNAISMGINYSLLSAVRQGILERTSELIDDFGLSYSELGSEGHVLLCEAVKNKHAAVAQLLLTSGAEVNWKNTNPMNTPLHFACINSDIEIVKMLLDVGANVDVENQWGRTPLHVAIGNERMERFERLVKPNSYVLARENDGTCLILVEIEIKCLQIVEHLLNYGADVNCMCTRKRKNCYTPLHLAVATGSKGLVTLLLSRGANVDIKGEDGITPLHVAAKKGCIHIVEDLLKHGACINSFTFYERYTPLHFASELGNEEAVKLFLIKGADVNACAKGNLTPLHIATKKGREIVVKLLLQHGAEVDYQDENGQTTLHIAVEKGYFTIVEDVLRHCPDINDQSNRSSLKIAVLSYGKENKKIVEALQEYGFTVDPEDANYPELLNAIVEKGYLKILKDLLKYGGNVNTSYEGFTPLHIAARYKQEEVAKLLISCEADLNAHDNSGKSPIIYAIENADLKMTNLLYTNRSCIKDNPDVLNFAVMKECIEIVKTLLQHGADVNASDRDGRTALHCTASSECLGIDIKGEIAELLLSKGANVDAQSTNGETTLHAAIEKGCVNVVEALLKHNANVNTVIESDGNTPVHLSAHGGNEEIITMLLNKGAKVNAKQKDGMTALHISTEKGHKGVVQLLLEYGANVDSKMKSGSTPLHLGAEKGYQQIIETLLKFGACIDSTDEDGRTALHIATEKGHYEVVFTLLEYGSNINITCRNDRTPLDYALAEIRPSHRAFSRVETAEALKRQIVKMKTANLYVCEQNLLSMRKLSRISGFQDVCEEEIARMKKAEINNQNISFYDILAKCTSSLAIYMRNENLVQVLKSGRYKKLYPIYASLIKCHFRKAVVRKELLEQGNKIFHFLCNNCPVLPYDCTERIFNYLSNEDLSILMEACEPLSSPNTITRRTACPY